MVLWEVRGVLREVPGWAWWAAAGAAGGAAAGAVALRALRARRRRRARAAAEAAEDPGERLPGDLAGRAAGSQKMLSYLPNFLRALEDQHGPGNPEGHIILCVAENKLSCHLLRERLLLQKDLPMQAFGYDSMAGVERFRVALAQFFNANLMRGAAVSDADVFVSGGCGPIIDKISFLLLSRGDGVLIPAPYYPAFDFDLVARNHCVPVPVETAGIVPTAGDLERAAAAAEANGVPLRALLLTNPNNPYGVVYPEEAMRELLAWGLARGLHVISDEIYGLSRFGGEPFVSALTIAPQLYGRFGQRAVDEHLHVLWGFSKDFCASGFRVGCCVSRNRELHAMLGNVGYFSAASNVTQYALANLLEDSHFVQKFLKENSHRLSVSYRKLTSALREAEIPFVEATASIFMVIDLRRGLRASTWEAEKELWDSIAEESKVLLTPGFDMHFPEPGFFRVCYAWVPPSALGVAVQRIKEIIDRAEERRADE